MQPLRPSPCTYRGNLAVATPCVCAPATKIKVHACRLHQLCVPSRLARNRIKDGVLRRQVRICDSCADYRAAERTLAGHRPITRLSWAVGVTSAPRRDPTLARCVRSLCQAGWNPTIFAEPGTFSDNSFRDQFATLDVPIIQRERQYGCWHNWLQMCRDLLEKHPQAEAILTVQDDTLFHRQALQFIDSRLWPADPEQIGFVSLYTPQHYSHRVELYDEQGRQVYEGLSWYHARAMVQRFPRWKYRQGAQRSPAGFHQVVTRSLWGACAMIFPRRSLERIIEHRIARSWTGAKPNPLRPPHEVRNSDTAIGKIVRALKLQQWWLVPSLTDHIADHSTLGHGGRQGRRHAPSFDPHSDLFAVFGQSVVQSPQS